MENENKSSKKGRVAGKQSDSILIKDDILLPYAIYVEDYGYTLVSLNGDKETSEGYYTGLDNLLSNLIRKKLIKSPKTVTLKEYMKEYIAMGTQISNLLKA